MRGIGEEETLTYSKEKQTQRWGENHGIRHVFVPLCEMPWASRIASRFILRFILVHSLTSNPGCAIIQGQYVLYTDGTVATARSSRFSSFHPVREKRRFVFLRAWTLLLVNKLASRSLSVSITPVDRVAFPRRVFLHHHPSTDRHPFALGNIEIKLGVIRLDITKYFRHSPSHLPLINSPCNLSSI